MKNYNHLAEVLYQFMDLESSNNLIWCGDIPFATLLFDECGFTVEDWSWYDGHIILFKSRHYNNITITYCASDSSFEFSNNIVRIKLKETPKLYIKKRRYDESTIIITQNDVSTETVFCHTPKLSTFSTEFNNFISELNSWQSTFDKNEDCGFVVSVKIKQGYNINEL